MIRHNVEPSHQQIHIHKPVSQLVYRLQNELGGRGVAPKVDVTFEEDTVWLSAAQMAELFQKAKSTINYHIQQVYEDGELTPDATMKKIESFEFSTKPLKFYNLVSFLSV